MNTEVHAESHSRDELEPGDVIAYRYRVEGLRRHHPLGELYRCLDQTSQREVLVHRLRREFADDEVRARLFEARGCAVIESAMIVVLLDYGEDLDGRPFVVMPWSDEASLVELERPLGFREALTIVEGIASALIPLHRRRLVHGGIEPASVLVDGEGGLVALLDFGLAPALDGGAQESRTLSLRVSPAYAAPELVRGEPLSPASDVYALGILLWELIFGVAPFTGPTLRVLDSHLNRALPELELPAGAPKSLEWTLRRMLAKSPVDRFADAASVAEQLRVDMLAPTRPVSADERGVAEDDGQLGLDAVVYERACTEQALPTVMGSSFEDSMVAPMRWRSGRRFVALAAVSCASLLGLWLSSFMASSSTDDALVAGALAGRASTHLRASEARGGDEASAKARTVGASSAPAPASASGLPALDDSPEARPVRLREHHFLAAKRELYRRAQARCLDNRMRRTLEVAVRVDSAGRVEAASVRGQMASTKIGRCVRRQAQKLKLPASEAGGFHTYTLRLR